jgi:arylsulfatase A-like enzyme
MDTWEPFTHALDRVPTALDAAPIQSPGFIAEQPRDADACEGEIASGSEQTAGR